ncbi:MAG TPA: response regulator [Bacteroidota bacterium]|nr:response regulator [Bacteroidota bacterium]
MGDEKMHILLIEDNKDFAKLVQVFLQRFDKEKFDVIWKENYNDAMAELQANQSIDIVLMDYFLPGKNGLDITKEILQKKYDVPIIFLTVNKDFELAVEVMKLGVEDYLVKEEISTPLLPKTIINVIEKRRLRKNLLDVEVSQQRLKAIHETLALFLNDLENPLKEMNTIALKLKEHFTADSQKLYVKMINDNVIRMLDKLSRVKSLKVDKTIKYIKDIKMIDLS